MQFINQSTHPDAGLTRGRGENAGKNDRKKERKKKTGNWAGNSTFFQWSDDIESPVCLFVCLFVCFTIRLFPARASGCPPFVQPRHSDLLCPPIAARTLTRRREGILTGCLCGFLANADARDSKLSNVVPIFQIKDGKQHLGRLARNPVSTWTPLRRAPIFFSKLATRLIASRPLCGATSSPTIG